MLKYKVRFAIVLPLILGLSTVSTFSAETWRLEKGQDWKPVSAEGKDKFLLAVAKVKQLVATGQTKAVRKALEQLKTDYPEIAGPDFDLFIQAELLFSKGKYTQAVRSYDKLLAKYPESALFEAVLDRQFAIATAFLAGQKRPVLGVFKMKGYTEGAKIMERITDRAGDAPIGIKAAVAVAKSLERRAKFAEAYYKWSDVSSRWPTGQTGKDSLFAMARCRHAAYKGPNYDASTLVSAKTYYENFKLRYPKDAEYIGVDKILKQINEQLAYKQFSVAQYYQKSGNIQSANLYYQMVIDDWPASQPAELAKTAMNGEKSSRDPALREPSKKEKTWKKSIRKLEELLL